MTNAGTLDDRYFEWLYKQIGSIRNRNPYRSYWHLARVLYTTPFFWFVRNDDNRMVDGQELRREFLAEANINPNGDLDWLRLECSMLEMLIALSQRLAFQSFGDANDWFWKLMQNIELGNFSDAVWNTHIEEEVKDKLETICRRTYGRDGVGGLFPLREPRSDQRRVELWYQAAAYLLEGDYINHGP